MEINGTLIVQILHVCIMYGILKLLVFKPALAIIQRQQQFFAQQQVAQQQYQKQLDQEKVLQEEESVAFTSQLQKQLVESPSVEYTIPVEESLQVPHATAQVIAQVTQAIVQKVDHVI